MVNIMWHINDMSIYLLWILIAAWLFSTTLSQVEIIVVCREVVVGIFGRIKMGIFH